MLVKQGDNWVPGKFIHTVDGNAHVVVDGHIIIVSEENVKPVDPAAPPAASAAPAPANGGDASPVNPGDTGAAPTGGSVTNPAIEVREGDTWTKVTVLETQGHKTHIRYDDGMEEWVGPERLRPIGAGPTTPTPIVTTPAGTTPIGVPAPAGASAVPGVSDSSTPGGATGTAAPQALRGSFAVGQEIERKKDNDWSPATVRQSNGPWTLISAKDFGQDRLFWIETWDLRVTGSSYDIDDPGVRAHDARLGETIPRDKPEPAPAYLGDPYHAGTLDGDPRLSLDQLNQSADNLSFDNAGDPKAGTPIAPIAVNRATGEFAAWGVRGASANFDRLLICPSDSTAVAVFGDRGRWPQILRTNLQSRGQMDKRTLYVSELKIIAATNQGDVLLSLTKDNVIQQWKWDGKAYHLSANIAIGSNIQGDIDQAEFVTADHVIIASNQSDVMLIDLPAKHALVTAKGVPGSPVYFHPSGQLIGLITGNGTATVLRTDDLSVIAHFDDVLSDANVAIDPTGQYVAFLASNHQIKVVKIADGSAVGSICPESNFRNRLDLVDPNFLVTDNSVTYEVKTGIPLWIYETNGAKVAPLANGQFVITLGHEKMVAVAVAAMPDHVARSAVSSATPDRFMLRPGMGIKIDGDYSGFGADASKAGDLVQQSVTRAGLVVSDKDEPFHLTVKVAAAPTETRQYRQVQTTPWGQPIGPMIGPMAGPTQSISVPTNVLSVVLTYKGDPVWQNIITFQAGSQLHSGDGRSFQDDANSAARPDVGQLGGLQLPSYLPVGATPGTPAALGESVLNDQRFVSERLNLSRPHTHIDRPRPGQAG